MPYPAPLTVLICIILAVVTLALHSWLQWKRRFRGCSLPPGPRRWPIVGNLFDLPSTEQPWESYHDWVRKYGDMVFYQVLGTPMLAISSTRIAFDLLENKSSIYSDRPLSRIDELMGWDWNIGFMPYGQRWRSIRRHVHEQFNRVATPKHRTRQTQEVYAFLHRCLDQTGVQLDHSHVRRLVAAVIVGVVYGIQIQSMDDEYIRLVTQSLDALGESRIHGKFWVDFIPFIRHIPRWLPGAASAQFASRWRPVVEQMVNKPFQEIIDDPRPTHSVSMEYLSKLEKVIDPRVKEEQALHVRHAAAVAYVAGAETSYSVIQSFFCSMAKHPVVQKKAQHELDGVVGRERLPTYEDYESLPYIRAIFLECMRLFTVLPMGLPHRLVTDDHYNGYFIPAGTIVVPNVWRMLHDPREYSDPYVFNPDRFIKDGTLSSDIRDPTTVAFGFGRRFCPGRHFATDTAFLTMACALHVFDIVPSLDQYGKELDALPELFGAVIAHPEPLYYMLRLRSVEAEKLIRATELMF